MTPEQLKNSILQLAIEGKLVPQNPAEGTGQDLLKQIKAALASPGQGRGTACGGRVKPLAPVTPADQPFVIPANWCWCRLGEIGVWAAGSTPPRENPNYYNGSIPWLKTGDLNDGYINKIPEYITDLALKETSVKLNEPGSILIAMYGATVGKLGILNIQATTNQACCACSVYKGIYNKFLFHFLLAYRKSFTEMATGGAQPNISKEKIIKTAFPLPPLAEQKRIVAKLEELLPLVEEYGKYYNRLQELNKSFPGKLKKSILQLAIEGKLVPQNPAEGTGQDLLKQIKAALASPGQGRGTACGGRVKPLAPVSASEQPFPIPENWCWCRLGETSVKIFAGGDKPEVFSENKTQKCFVPVIANGEINEGVIGYTNEATVKEVSLTVSGRGTIGFSCVRREPFCPIVRLLVVIPSKHVDIDFLKLVLSVLIEKGNGTSVKQLTVPMIVPKILPLPPLAEQRRIVAKLEELLPLVEKLEE